MAHTRLLGRAMIASLALGLTLAVAGCGNQHLGPGYADGSAGGPTYAHQALTKDELMPAAYAAATKAGTARIRLSVTTKTSTGSTCSCMRATGDVTFGARKRAMALTVVQQGRRVAMRLVDGMVYLQIPSVTRRGTFVAVDPRDRKSSLARTFAGVADDMDPLKSMESAVQTAERVGTQTMDGVTVEHYKTTIETASLLHKAGYAANAGGMPDKLDYDLWLDEKHLIRRVSFKVAHFSYEETLSRWGEPVHVQKPAAGQIMRMPGI